MKWFMIFLIILLLFPVIKAEDIEINLQKEIYSPGETFQALVKLNVEPLNELTASNFNLKYNGTTVPTAKFIKSLNNSEYYIYFNLPKTLENGSYDFGIYNTLYKKNGLTKNDALTKTFNINKKDHILYITPGFIIKEIEYYETPILTIKLTNNGNEIEDITISTEGGFLIPNKEEFAVANNDEDSLSIRTNISRRIKTSEGKIIINYRDGSYEIPVILTKKSLGPEQVNETDYSEEDLSNALAFTTNKEKLSVKITQLEILKDTISFINYANTTLYNLKVEILGEVAKITTITPSTIQELKANQEVLLEITINKDQNIDKNYSGTIQISNEKTNLTISLEIQKIIEEIRTLTNKTIINETKIPEKDIKENNINWVLVSVALLITLLIVIATTLYIKSKNKY